MGSGEGGEKERKREGSGEGVGRRNGRGRGVVRGYIPRYLNYEDFNWQHSGPISPALR